jgi:Protein of unknown function (DUF3638)
LETGKTLRICLSFGILDDSAYIELIQLLFLFRKSALLAAALLESSSMDQAVSEMMAMRIGGLRSFVIDNPETLTSCLRNLFDRMPGELTWTPVTNKTGTETVCFEAEHENLYSVNCFDGTVLVNGLPANVLPSSIVASELYQRVFGSMNFVVLSNTQCFRTDKMVDGRYLYEFQTCADGSLLIREEDWQNGDTLLLLEKDNVDLPVLLREQHSHWHSAKHGSLFLRGVSYSDRQIRYVMTKELTYQIPSSFQTSEPADLIEQMPSFDRLMQGETSAAAFVSGLEFAEFVHIFLDGACQSLRFSLPRLKISFLLKDGILGCLEFKGFSVVDRAAVRNTLPSLSSCVVLRHPNRNEKVIVAEGAVKKNATIEIPRGLAEEIIYFVYDVHMRFRYLHTESTLGRLHLASLYASCECWLPEKRWRKRPSAIAIEYARWSWRNEPFAESEERKLMEISCHTAKSCSTLSLICSWLWKCSRSVEILHRLKAKISSGFDLDPLAVDDYNRGGYTPRLESIEEESLLGLVQQTSSVTFLLSEQGSRTLIYVKSREEEILAHCINRYKNAIQKDFPLKRLECQQGMENRLVEDLEKSYRVYCGLDLLCPCPSYSERSCNLLAEVRENRLSIENAILQEQDSRADHSLSLCSGRIEQASSIDMLRLVSDDSSTSWDRLNPFMDRKRRQKLRSDCLDWSVLCVLEDRLERIQITSLEMDPQALVAELCCIRRWDPQKHPRWIAFEVEQCLQIRPDQYEVVKQMLHTTGSIIQLNMGLGKLFLLCRVRWLIGYPPFQAKRVCWYRCLCWTACHQGRP